MPKTKNKKLRPVIKCHGGKYYLSSWIINHFPEDYVEYDYVEPFVGGGSVILNKERCAHNRIEVINDANLGLIQIYRALRDEPKHFITKLRRTRYTDRVFLRELRKQGNEFPDYMDYAINEYIVRRMSRGGLKKAFAWSERKRGGIPGDVNAWNTMLAQLPLIGRRIEDTSIFNKPAVEVLKAFNEETTFCYCDPPYLHDARTSTDSYEEHEMTTDDHIELSEVLSQYRGKVIVSGYPSVLYKRLYKEWNCAKKKIANHASQQKTKTYNTECLWMNY